MATEKEIEQFFVAIKGNRLKTVKQMLKQDSFLINYRMSGTNQTCLHIAAQEGHVDIVKVLLREALFAKNPKASFLNAQDADGNTALHYAARDNNLAVADALAYYHEYLKTEIKNNNGAKPVALLPTGPDVDNFSILLDNPLEYLKIKDKEIKRARIKAALIVGGVVAAGVAGVGIAALALTLLGISFLPLASLTVLIAASAVAAVGIIGLGITVAAAINFYRNRTDGYHQLKDDKFDSPSATAPAHSTAQATQGLGGKKPVTKSATPEQLPTIHSSPIAPASSTTSSRSTTTPAQGPTGKPTA